MMQSHGYTILGYTFHLLGLYCNILAFAVIIFIWNKILQSKAEKSISKIFLRLMLIVNLLVTVIGVMYLGESHLPSID